MSDVFLLGIPTICCKLTVIMTRSADIKKNVMQVKNAKWSVNRKLHSLGFLLFTGGSLTKVGLVFIFVYQQLIIVVLICFAVIHFRSLNVCRFGEYPGSTDVLLCAEIVGIIASLNGW